MIITRTPYRISFVGGGSDLPAFYTKTPGSVVSVTMKRYMYLTLHPTFNPKEIKLKYAKTEIVTNVNELEHPIVKAVLKKLQIRGGIEITSVGDIPAQTGLGSSSSFTVGLLKALYILRGEYKTKEEIAEEACEIEINTLKETIGKQDQYAASFGGLNQFTFLPDGKVETNSIFLEYKKRVKLEKSLLLFYTGLTRSASSVLREQSSNLQKKSSSREIMEKMASLATPLREELERGNIDSMGEYLHENWILKKSAASTISSGAFDKIYDKARNNGAIGGKILGAGGGGFFLFYVRPKDQDKLKMALKLQCLPVEFDFQGSKEIYVHE